MSGILYIIASTIGNILAYIVKQVVFPLLKWVFKKGIGFTLIALALIYTALVRMSEHTGNDTFSDKNINDVKMASEQLSENTYDSIRSIEKAPYLIDTVGKRAWQDLKTSNTYKGFKKDMRWIGVHLDNIAETSNTYKGIKKDIKSGE